ncbi:hypothetical protein Bhyg_07604, partial [Pseudolycoriella hygida]
MERNPYEIFEDLKAQSRAMKEELEKEREKLAQSNSEAQIERVRQLEMESAAADYRVEEYF